MKKIVLFSLLAAILVSPVAFSSDSFATTEVKAVELKDGTKVQVEGDKVFVLDAKGEKKPAPDGTHETKDGQKLVVKGGVIVK